MQVLKDGCLRMRLSTHNLEPEPGDMIVNPQLVFEQDQATAAEHFLNSAEYGSLLTGADCTHSDVEWWHRIEPPFSGTLSDGTEFVGY